MTIQKPSNREEEYFARMEFERRRIDKCSRCEGIWLDCGELERLGEGEGGFLSGVLRIFR